jgi:hypothetical protein
VSYVVQKSTAELSPCAYCNNNVHYLHPLNIAKHPSMIQHISFLLITLFYTLFGHAQQSPPTAKPVITTQPGKTGVRVNEKGDLIINITPQDLKRIKTKGSVQYSDFGATGNGKIDDIDAIAATHAFANQYGLKVKTNKGATYYIGGKERTAIIQTDTDFGDANFIIDDTKVQNRNAAIFEVSTSQVPFKPEGITALRKYQQKVDISSAADCIITATDTSVKHYIRFGPNQDNGSAQKDIFIVDQNGNVDSNTPIIWDFNNISTITALPLDKKKLNITGGKFTTIANQAESKYTYYTRNISIKRSNVVVDGLLHHITGEGEQGAPYNGFISISNCAYVKVKNSILTGHKTFRTVGSAGVPVSMGSYDILVNASMNVSFINCSQTNDINDSRYWGIMGSNYSKNLLYDSCTFSRFDAHKGVANATIRNSVLGHMGINAIGSGTLMIENTRIYGRSLVNLRSDYGSTWEGTFIIRNCTFVPEAGKPTSPVLINGSYSGLHDFGYPCYMPERIIIENLTIDDSNHPAGYAGPAIFADFNPQTKNSSYVERFPYIKTKEVVMTNVKTSSGKPVRVSDNKLMFEGVEVRFVK